MQIQLKKTFTLKHKTNIVSYAVKTVENLFTWCGHERYAMIMGNENEFLIINLIVLFLQLGDKIIHGR